MKPDVSWSAQSWEPLPVPEILKRDISGNTRLSGTVASGGYKVETITLACLPDEDMASFSVDVGTFNGGPIEAKSLSGHFVRIDVQDNEDFPTSDDTDFPSAGFKTVFVGYVYNSKHTLDPSNYSGVANGKCTYYCQGILSRTRDWPMVYHAVNGPSSVLKCYGNPGYNVPINGMFRSVFGNKSSSTDATEWDTDPTDGWVAHALPIDATSTMKWTDLDTIKHALSSSRQAGEPIFTTDFSNAAGLFDGAFAWTVNLGDSCFDHLRRVCSRQRGRGSVYADWTSDGTPTGAISLFLRARPAFSGEVVYKTKSAYSELTLDTEVTIKGQTAGTDTAVDVSGDHRFFGAFQYDDRASAVYDYIEIVGERIQTVANLSLFGAQKSLEKGWTEADENQFNATTNYQQRIVSRFRHVCRRFIVKQQWDFRAYVDRLLPSTSFAAPESFNIICGEGGEVRTAPWLPDDLTNSPVMARIMSDMPIYEGKTYVSPITAYWSGASEYYTTSRVPPQLLYQAKVYSGQPDTEHTWIPLEKFGFNLQVDDTGLLISHQAEESTGTRVFSYARAFGSTPSEVSSDVTETSGMDPEKLIVVIGLELSNHVRMGDVTGHLNATEKGRRLTIPVNGVHLWCGVQNAIWQCDPFNLSSGKKSQALRFSADKPVTFIRDDRDQLSFMYGLAKKYYGEVHNPGTWSLRDCGLKSAFAVTGGTGTYPALGRLVSTVAVTPAQKVTLNTPVTSIHYDHNEGITTWRTDYVNYQPGIQ